MHRRSSALVAIAVMVVTSHPYSGHSQAINEQDSLALVQIFNDMGGSGWQSNQNWLEGPVGSWWGVTTTENRVTGLLLGFNNLSGPLSDGLFELEELTRLGLSSNSLPGSIPNGIGQLVKLKFLDLSGNLLTGAIPESMANLVELQDLYLYSNRRDDNPGLTGPIPGFLGGLTQLRNLEIDYNGFTGQIPESLGDLDNLVDLFIGGNQLSGAVPASIGQMQSLEILGINDNQLVDLPDLSGLPNLLGLFVQNNRFTFEDLEPNVNAAQNVNRLAPQDSVETEVNGNTLSVSVGGTNNQYQWVRTPYVEIPGATDRMFSPENPGTYFCEITSPLIPGLRLSSRTVSVGGLSDIVVNMVSDEPDPTPFDESCDVDSQTEGMQCTLRAAIQTVNAAGGGATIRFNIPGSEIPVIRPLSALPAVSVPAEIDGTTQSAGRVELDGVSAGPADGLLLSGSDITIRGMVINRFDLFGIRINAGSDHVIENNLIGMKAEDVDSEPNVLGGILVSSGARDVTIGSETAEGLNVVTGGIRILDAETRGVRILRNIIRIAEEDLSQGPLVVPVDLGNDGPTCTEWDEMPEAPNRHMPPPRILSLSGQRVRGISRPGATIVLFRVEQTGRMRGRYFAREVEPLDVGVADSQGLFEIPVALEPETLVAATATDSDGNTSELSQLRRPVIFLPGVGGSWLEGANGDNLWLPGSGFDAEINDRFARLAMDPDGRDIEQISVDGIVELLGFSTYGPALEYLQDAGYPGMDLNIRPDTLDLWRFAYDWRRDVNLPAVTLRNLIDQLVGGGDVVARSCEVDIVSHSNGGMVASVYVRRNPAHSRNHVHRLVTSGTPYLGSTQVVAAHTRGYMFGIEQTIPIDMEWGRIVQMFRNLPGAYGLLPSRAYWMAVDGGSESHLPFYLDDLRGNSLRSYDATFEFMTGPKTGTYGRPEGLGRNRSMWMQQQSAVHDVMNDWRTWSGPPQIYRMVGDLPDGTATGWFLPDELPVPPDNSAREEPGDTPAHVSYRESLVPIVGLGDGTVPLASATLGADERVGNVDFSGVGSGPWIEEFEEYPCQHVPLVGSSCFRRADNLGSLERIVQILKSGYQVVPGSEVVPDAPPAGKKDGGASILYVQSSAPVAVTISDESGNVTGPASAEEPGVIEYGIEDLGYWASLLGAAVSMPAGQTFAVTVRSAGEAATIRTSLLYRGGTGPAQVLYPDAQLGAEGSMQTVIDQALPASPLNVDSDGDGLDDIELGPGVTIQTASPVPAVPRPTPRSILVESLRDAPTPSIATLEIPDAGAVSWSWSISQLPDWLDLDETDGQTPATVLLSVDDDQLDAGFHTADLIIDLSFETYTRSIRIPVELLVRDQAGVLAEIVISPDQFQMGRQTSQVFEVRGLDQNGLPISFTPVWTATGGRIDEAGIFYSGDETGTFIVSVTDESSGLSAEAIVDVVEVDLSRDPEARPADFSMASSFPEPAHVATTLAFDLPGAADVRLSVHDLLGRTVAVLIDGALPGGSYRIRFDVANLPSGTYFVRLVSGAHVATEAITVVR